MSIELRSGRYLYRKTRRNGRVESEYVCRGETAVLIAAMERADQDRREMERRDWLARRRAYEAEDRPVAELSRLVNVVVVAALTAAGFHQHRRTWRRRRAMATEITTAGRATAVAVPGAGITRAEEFELLERVAAGDRKALPRLTQAFQAAAGGKRSAALLDMAGNPAEQLRRELFEAVNAGCDVARTAGRVKLEQVQRELEGPDPTPLEKLLAERAAVCWHQLYTYEVHHVQQTRKGVTLREADYLQKRIDRAHRRLLSSVKSLAQVRRLALPTIQVNIGDKQVNVGG